jgi:hypothetical protein
VREFDTLEAAQKSLTDSEKFWRSINYQVWFAEITDPDGKVILKR